MRLVGGKQAAVKSAPENRADAALVDEIYKGFVARTASKRYTDRYAADVIARCRDFAAHCQKYPWHWDADDFDRWNLHLRRDRAVAVSTQRKYQKAVYALIEYLETSPHWLETLRQKFGLTIKQFINRDNSITHKDNDESQGKRGPFLSAQFRRFIDAIQRDINLFQGVSLRKYRASCRDLVLFAVIHTCGLRADEAITIDLGSFLPNPRQPDFGDFGAVIVLGKAKKGGGKRARTIQLDHPELPGLLKWYVTHIRYLFLTNALPNERAMFLSERGKRISYSSLWDRYTHFKSVAGLADTDLVMHSMRHSSATETMLETDPETTRRKLGHGSLSVTAGYTHIPDAYTQKQIDMNRPGFPGDSLM